VDDVPSKIFVSGGFADVSGTQCTILAEQAVNVADLVEADIDASIETLSGELEAAQTQGAKRRIEAALNVAFAKKQALVA
jgi:F-type H+-transporting ATPase subunit epsilon